MAPPSSSPSSSASIDPGGETPSKISNHDSQSLNRELEIKLQSPPIPAAIPAAKVPSYAERFKSSLRNLRKISNPSFLEDGTPVVQAPESVLLQTSELWKDHVVAHFHGRRPSATKILADLNPVWGKFGNITTADGNLAAQELLFAPTWAVLKNVPPQLYSLDGISVVASGIGEPLHTEKSRLDPYHFGDTKVKVEIDLSKTPPEVVEVRDTQGNSVRVVVEYPSLPPKCINCGKYGHLMNRCHKPLMKRPQPQKKEKVISVVKSGEEMSLVEKSQGDSSGATENEKVKQRKARSRSRRRSRSRARNRVRALSSPPESKGVSSIAPLVEVEHDEVPQKGNLVGEKEVSRKRGSNFSKEDSDVAVSQLEEGEISIDPGAERAECLEKSQNIVTEQQADNPLWFTKHSKSYRRALRQMANWKASGAIGSPPKSAKLLTRGSPSGKQQDS
ncbi:uncharacterized protein LOC108858615 [Raphanus sativus]|uniref:Uncharacterized protein LOC108858615 n=1 Tax=Raphanus sativus TaxID=3726 RepID=A0A6J0NV58_RAPSA|nr:uncharacterized protein LOC108858615 [Raphanus sativus]